MEIRKAARGAPLLAADGAVQFLVKVSPALEQVDSSSGAIGTAVNHAIEELVSIIAKAPADLSQRARWLERLWEALMLDAIPYIERLGDFWGELCASKELARAWADNLIETLRQSWAKPAGGSPPAVLTSRERRHVYRRCWRRNGTRICWSCSKRRRLFGGNTVAGEFERWSLWVGRMRLFAMRKPRADSMITRS
jgi:hypothetical protein